MTKRTAQFSNNLQNKRQKRHEDIDDLWGEDLDETVLDDCFKVCEVRLGFSFINNYFHVFVYIRV